MSQGEAPIPESPAAEAAAAPRRLRRVLPAIGAGLFCALLFVLCLWLFTRNNTFPVGFHPDEGGKVQQVVYDERNYRHPQLMLEATQIWMRFAEIPDDTQSVVIAGRQVAAFFGALSVAMLSLTAYLCAGWWGLVMGSILVGLCPPLLTYSHYMKEDTSLLVGVAMTILASRIIWMTRRWYARIPAWALLAAGCALAASGKYVGAMTIALPVLLIFVAPGFRWYKPPLRLLLFVPLLVLFLGIINHRTLNLSGENVAAFAGDFGQWEVLLKPSFLRGLEGEAMHSATSHWGLTANRPNSYTLRTAISQSWPAAAIAAFTLPLVLLVTRKQGWGWEVIMILFTAFCAVVLSYSIILFPRYSLPVTVMLHLLGAIALGRLLLAGGPRPVWQFTLGAASAIGLLAIYAPLCADYTHQFSADSRYALNNWAAENLPLNARVFSDGYAELHDYSLPFIHKRRDIDLRTSFILPQMGGLPYYLRTGEAYYVICDLSYSRYFEPSAYPAPGNESSSEYSRRFYEYLLKTQTPVWSSVTRNNMHAFTNPDIYVYRLTPEMTRELQN